MQEFVGRIEATRLGRNGRVNAILVETHLPAKASRSLIKLWSHEQAEEFWSILHPRQQVWVHVDYAGYRQAYRAFGMPPIPNGHVLDHIQNRKAVRLRGHSHPFLRLCPICKATNTNAGGLAGAEGMEREHIRSIADLSPAWQAEIARILSIPVQHADPADLTKMLGIAPGTHTLDGVRDLQNLFFDQM